MCCVYLKYIVIGAKDKFFKKASVYLDDKKRGEEVVERLFRESEVTDADLKFLIETDKFDTIAIAAADSKRREIYKDEVYIRGLIEFTNHCKNNCFYCGIRAGNKNVKRYRLTKEEILKCCEIGYELGFRTYVLQGGEDLYYTDSLICDIILEIRNRFSDCAVTLSVGERSRESYQAFFNAGASRYLLRQETADEGHYKRLHPENMSLANRKRCLYDLKDIGYQVGAGFMVGSPHQTAENIIKDLRFLEKLQPDMIGIGPYITHKDTPFSGFANGSVSLTVKLIAVLRLLFPYALIPATTALGTLDAQGRELGLKAGANVLMPNLSPKRVRKLYEIYDNKICTGSEAAACISCLKNRVRSAGYRIVTSVGNPIKR